MYERNLGFVLITLLILLLILSLLATHAINNALLQDKMRYNFFIGIQRIHDADRVLQRAEVAIERSDNWWCKLKSTSANYVLEVKNTQGLSSLQGCRTLLAEKREGYYVIQDISDEISQVCVDENTEDKAMYYRVTAWVKAVSEQSGQGSKEGILVQSTYAKLLKQPVQKTCKQFPIIPKSTRLSWRLVF